jgi:hypothetical protein
MTSKGSGDRCGFKRVTITRQPKVSWFDVGGLVRTAIKALTSTVVGALSDRREVMAALDPRTGAAPTVDYDYSTRDEIWIDYIADLGDGWNATYSVACLIGDNHLAPSPATHYSAAGYGPLLPRGDILVFGGDQVYPVASAENYATRCYNPYYCARPWVLDEETPKLFAIPGNHDWYDGLTSFLRYFCQPTRRWFGIWETQQRRSYFALKLPHDWWLWAFDVQFQSDVDGPQNAYFAEQARLLQPGDRIILCTPEPWWIEDSNPKVKDPSKIQKRRENIEFLSKGTTARGAEVVVTIAGDLHHYVHYFDKTAETHYITCGGGGAFTYGTHFLPRELETGAGQSLELQAAFPDDRQSRRLRYGTLLFPFVNFAFTSVLAGVQLLLLWCMQNTSLLARASSPQIRNSWIDFLSSTPFDSWASPAAVAGKAWALMFAGSFSLVLFPVFLLAMIFYARYGARAPARWFVWAPSGLLHGLAHVTLGIGMTWLASRTMGSAPEITDAASLLGWASFGAALWVSGGLLFGAYLVVANIVLGGHDQEVFSGQAIEDWKSFLRIRIARDSLTIYPIGLRQTSRRWRLAPHVREVSSHWSSRWKATRWLRESLLPWLGCPRIDIIDVPHGAGRIYEPETPLRPELIENPIQIRRRSPRQAMPFDAHAHAGSKL